MATNDAVKTRNSVMLDKLPGDHYTIPAIDSKKDQKTSLPDDINRTGNLHTLLKIKVGARVMLTRNVDVPDGLTNGAQGTVVAVIDKTTPTVILVQFDNNRIGEAAKLRSLYKNINQSAVPIGKYEASFTVGSQNTAEVTRVQFPLTLAWAITIHKTRGATLDGIVVDMSKGRFGAGQAYVAFSRVRNLHGLNIINFKDSKIRVDKTVEEEMKRLRQHPISAMPTPIVIDAEDVICIGHLNVRGLLTNIRDIEQDPILKYLDIFV